MLIELNSGILKFFIENIKNIFFCVLKKKKRNENDNQIFKIGWHFELYHNGFREVFFLS